MRPTLHLTVIEYITIHKVSNLHNDNDFYTNRQEVTIYSKDVFDIIR